jgi:hypothetical protein
MMLSIIAGFTSFVAVMVCIAVNSFGHPGDI